MWNPHRESSSLVNGGNRYISSSAITSSGSSLSLMLIMDSSSDLSGLSLDLMVSASNSLDSSYTGLRTSSSSSRMASLNA